jgi:hypothetical protein
MPPLPLHALCCCRDRCGLPANAFRLPLMMQNTVKALSRAKLTLDGNELAFDAMPLATQLFLGNISRYKRL